MGTQFAFGCAICANAFDIDKTVCSTGCGHIYHETCLREWMLIQGDHTDPQTCPKCRAPIQKSALRRLYLHQVDMTTDDSSASENNPNSPDEMESNDGTITASNDGTLSAVLEGDPPLNELVRTIMADSRRLTCLRNTVSTLAFERRLDSLLNDIDEMNNTVDGLMDGLNSAHTDFNA